MASTNSSTLTPQDLVDYARPFPWTQPVTNVAGWPDEPALSFINIIVQKICAKPNPWKWNAGVFPKFYTQPYQQDYPTSISQNVLGWLQAAVLTDINSTAPKKPIIPLTVVQSLLPTFLTATPQKAAWIPNALAQTGSWPGASVPGWRPVEMRARSATGASGASFSSSSAARPSFRQHE